MPQLLIFAPCEKVIISQDENNPTLIALFQEIGAEFELLDIKSEQTKAIAPIIPLRWSIFALWRASEGDLNKHFTQVTKFITPSGKVVIDQSVDFHMEKQSQRVVAHVPGIPVGGGSGTWLLQVFIHEVGQLMPTAATGTYPLEVHLVEKKHEAST